MSPRTALACLSGGLLTTGLLLLLGALRPGDRPEIPARRRARSSAPRWAPLTLAGIAASIAVLLLTRWVSVAVGIGLVVARARWLFGSAAATRASLARLDALATWTERLRDLTLAGAGLPDALRRSLPAAPPVLRPALDNLDGRLAVREPLDAALLALADDLDDPGGDLLAAALVLNARVQGRQLGAVLGELAASLRAELDIRRRVEAERRGSRRAVRIVVGVTVGLVLLLALVNPVYMAPYRTPAGQAMLAVIVAIYGGGFLWLRRLADVPAPARILAGRDGGQ